MDVVCLQQVRSNSTNCTGDYYVVQGYCSIVKLSLDLPPYIKNSKRPQVRAGSQSKNNLWLLCKHMHNDTNQGRQHTATSCRTKNPNKTYAYYATEEATVANDGEATSCAICCWSSQKLAMTNVELGHAYRLTSGLFDFHLGLIYYLDTMNRAKIHKLQSFSSAKPKFLVFSQPQLLLLLFLVLIKLHTIE